MLQGRLSPRPGGGAARGTVAGVALVAAGLLGGCASADGTDDGALREQVIEPGITALDESRRLVCGADASTLRTVLESYELLEGAPAADEAALVAGGYLHSETESYDVVDGEIVVADPACEGVPIDLPATEIVTATEPPPSADEVLADFGDDGVAAVGGADCARELAAVYAAGERYVAEYGSDPADLDALVASGSIEVPVTRWVLAGDRLVPAPDSGCIDPSD